MLNGLSLTPNELRVGVRLKLLLPIVAILIAVIAGLSITLLTVQQRSNRTLQEDVRRTLDAANVQIGEDLVALRRDIGRSLNDMSRASAENLSRSTTKALEKQKFRIEYDWETMLMENAESLARLMAHVSVSSILSDDRQSLNHFVEAAILNPRVIYGFYFKTDGKRLTRLIHDNGAKIKTYLQAEGKNRYEKILTGAKADASVMVINKPIKFGDTILGFIELGIDKSAVGEKITEMSERFTELVAGNNELISMVLASESEKVRHGAATTVENIIEKNRAAIRDTGQRLEQASMAMIQRTKQIVIVGGVICILLVAGLLFFIVQQVVKPLRKAVAMVKDIAEGEGDLVKRLNVSSTDEVGELSGWFNSFLDKLQGIIQDIAGTARSLGASSDSLAGLSSHLSDGAHNMSSMSSTVAAAADQMSSNMSLVAGSSDEAAANVNRVSMAAEGMTDTINHIVENSEKARVISEEAVAQAAEASVRMDKLNNAAQSIGKVTRTITEISDQTNLLALNATIESARAGEVGKGFAVVANEIKGLARQTAAATQEIHDQIEDIQGSTADTIVQIKKISKVINGMNEIVSNIATAVDGQSITTREIFGNVLQASQGIQDVNSNVSQGSVVSREIAQEIAGINEISIQLSGNSSQVNESADELNRLAGQLNDLVGKFKYEDE